MRLGTLSGRLCLFGDAGAVDVHKASSGRFGPDPQSAYQEWDEFTRWAASASWADARHYAAADLGAPSPQPRQVFAVGLNYRAHAAEAGSPFTEEFPLVFTKFPTSVTGPNSTVVLPPGGDTDWEAELVVVLGRRAERVSAADAWSYVAGVTVGQDITERKLQMTGPAPQFSMGKSFPGFGPTGPWLVTVDELTDPDDLEIECRIGDETMQHSSTGDLIFSVPRIIELLSGVTPLLPGDLIFTGTPSGVGMGRKPPRYLASGERLTTSVTGVGEISQTFVARA
jgi:2,4-didehydro-3-deoxy-L-rhamnonate hydrolase